MPSKGLIPFKYYYRTLIELEIYKAQVEKLQGGFQGFDEALDLVTWAISKNAEAFDQVPGLPNCYIAKTDSFKSTKGDTVFPALRVFFRIEDVDTVLLCAISKIK